MRRLATSLARGVGQSEAATTAHKRCVSEIMKVLGLDEKGARGMKILTEHVEQAMGTLWANQELEELCSYCADSDRTGKGFGVRGVLGGKGGETEL